MKVKDLIMKLDNSGIIINFYEGEKLTTRTDIDTMKNIYKRDKPVGEIYNRTIKKWIINGYGEAISVTLK